MHLSQVAYKLHVVCRNVYRFMRDETQQYSASGRVECMVPHHKLLTLADSDDRLFTAQTSTERRSRTSLPLFLIRLASKRTAPLSDRVSMPNDASARISRGCCCCCHRRSTTKSTLGHRSSLSSWSLQVLGPTVVVYGTNLAITHAISNCPRMNVYTVCTPCDVGVPNTSVLLFLLCTY